MNRKIILASASPRRRELLSQIGMEFEVITSNSEEIITKENPWEIVKNTLNVGDVVRVKVVRIVPFGAFAEVIPFVDGLIHISQISTERIDKVASALSIGESVDAKIVGIDFENKKISLSIRALLEPETYVMPGEAEEAAPVAEEAPAEEVAVEDVAVAEEPVVAEEE